MRFPLLAIFLLTLPTIGVCAPSDYLFESEGAGLEIESSPSGADVYVNGVRRGKTPLVLDNVVPGAARLVLEKDGYWPRRTAVVVPEGKRITVRLKLEEARGIIRVEKPEGNGIADPAVLIDGERASLGDNEVLEGRHSVRLQAFGFEDETRTVFVGRGEREIVQVALRPARFTLAAVRFSRGRFNPANPGLLGSTTLSFTVNAPGAASVSISDRTGNEAFSAELPAMDTWEQSIAWTGRSSEGEPLADGLYTAAVTARSADGRTAATEKTAVVIDSAAVIRPASLHGDAGGLLFAPEARTLPAGSFQVEAAALFGKPFGSGAFDAPPFSLGIRFSPLEGTEAVAALRVEPARDDGGVVSFGASGKRALIPSPGACPWRSPPRSDGRTPATPSLPPSAPNPESRRPSPWTRSSAQSDPQLYTPTRRRLLPGTEQRVSPTAQRRKQCWARASAWRDESIPLPCRRNSTQAAMRWLGPKRIFSRRRRCS
jgi:hypothetical protein